MENFIKYQASQCVYASDAEAMVAEFSAQQASASRDFRDCIAAREEEEVKSGKADDTSSAEDILAAFLEARIAAATAKYHADRAAGGV
jgi:hypothetical protein